MIKNGMRPVHPGEGYPYPYPSASPTAASTV